MSRNYLTIHKRQRLSNSIKYSSCVAAGISELLKNHQKPATFSIHVMTEINFATSTHQRINQNDVHCLHLANEWATAVV